MISKILYEQQGVSDDEAEVISILKNDFDNIQSGDVIAEVETSKAIIEVEANSDGYIRYVSSLNEIVKVGNVIAIIAEKLEELDKIPGDIIEESVDENLKEKSISAKALKIAKSLNISEETLMVTKIEVGGGAMLKRIQPAPQGRAHRIRKRSNHVTIVVGGAK